MSEAAKKGKTLVAKCKTARLTISAIILFVTYCGISAIDIHSRGFWFFTQMLSITVCSLVLWLYWYIYHNHQLDHGITIWHQLLHWCGTLISIYSLSLLVSSGMIAANQAGVVTLMILSFSLFLSGVYTDTIFILLGISLGLLTCSIATISKDTVLYNSGITAGACLLIFVIAQFQYHSAKKKTHEKK